MPKRNNSLYVRHLPDACRHEDLRRAFGRYGRIVDITIPLDFFTGRMKGFSFIEFEEPKDAEDAHYHMDHSRFMGRDIEVEFTRGYRKTPAEMRGKEPRDEHRDGGSRRARSRSRSRSRSVSRKGRGAPYSKHNDRRDEGRRNRNRNGRSVSRSKSPTRSASRDNMDNGKGSRRSDRRDGRPASRSPPPRRRGSGSRSRSRSY